MASVLCILALVGVVYSLIACVAVWRFRRVPPPRLADPGAGVVAPGVALLKPLHGREPRLAENLGTFLAQEYPGQVRLVAGLARGDDPAGHAFAEAKAAYRGASAVLIVNGARHGANGKIGNLINMDAAAGAVPVLVMSDSDIAAPPGYLAHVVHALAPVQVGAVSCLYHGRGDAGPWSEVAAAGVSYQFLPSAAVAIMLKLSWPCMGATIALRRETLAAIGGFEAYRDVLADDNAIGAAVRGLGLTIAYPPLLLTHAHAEATVAEWARRELRQNVTIRTLSPAGYVGSLATHPVPMALIGLAAGPSAWTAGVLGAALVSRLLLQWVVDRAAGRSTGAKWWMPLRDIAGFGLYLAGFAARAVDWRGARLGLVRGGRVELRQGSLRR